MNNNFHPNLAQQKDLFREPARENKMEYRRSKPITGLPAQRNANTSRSEINLADVDLFKESKFRRIALHPWTLSLGLAFTMVFTVASASFLK